MIPNELRIGNWINYKNEPIVATMIGQYGIQSKNDDRIINAKFSTTDLKPIPLTPEILERCGFENSISHYLDYFKDTGIGNNVFGIRLGRPFKHENYWWPEIKYLHQLQNLYFALTGKELECKIMSSREG